MKFITLVLLLLWGQNSMAAKLIYGKKSANPGELSEKELSPVMTKALVPEESDFEGGFNMWVPYVMPTPYQENAGSCLFMSHTAVAETLVNERRNRLGYPNIDLSERYFMNLSKADIGDNLIDNWITDTIYRLNATKKMYLNRDFPYMKGWYRPIGNGQRVFAQPNEQGAYYGVRANWVVDLDSLAKKPSYDLPTFKRDILFEDPKGNRWNVGTAPKDIVQRVKNALNTKKGPVTVIYNHTGFWHAVMIAGYNDNITNHGCPFVSDYPLQMRERADQIREEANNQSDQDERDRLERKARLFERRAQMVETGFQQNGGCSNKGAFYVRDSINPDPSMPLYDYDPNQTGEEQHLNPSIILREYEWLEQLANHVMHIYVD